MTTTLFAQPYDISATGFYFETVEEYDNQVGKAVNDYGEQIEEFEIQFIDGEALDAELAKSWSLSQGNFSTFFEAVENWDDDRKHRYIIAVGECGYGHDEIADDPNQLDIDIYYVDSLRELAEQFVDEGLYGPIPAAVQFYIDYEAMARDLAIDFSETEIAGERLVYACR